MKTTEMDLGGFVSHLSAATEYKKYDWRLSPISKYSYDQMILLGTLGVKKEYSVVEVVLRRMYELIEIDYPDDAVTLSIQGDNKYGKKIYEQTGVSMAILHTVEIASLTFYRDKPLTPIHHMLAIATKVAINFKPPATWSKWPDKIRWCKTAYNYGELLSERQQTITEDQQRRIEGLALSMLNNRSCAADWLSNLKHDNFSGLSIWGAIAKNNGFAAVENYLCWIDRQDHREGSD